MYSFVATMRREPSALARFKAAGLLEGGFRADHDLAWSLFKVDPDAKRDFLFRVVDRDPITIEVRGERPCHVPEGLWDVREIPSQPAFTHGDLVDLQMTVVLTRSDASPKPKGRGRKSDLVSYLLRGIRSGTPCPEVAHLSPHCSGQDVAVHGALWWFCRNEGRLGLHISRDATGIPLFHAAILPYVGCGRKRREDEPPLRGLGIRLRASVTEPQFFGQILKSGIGSARAYGFGMVFAQHAG